MKANHWALALSLVGAVSVASVAKADVAYFSSEAAAETKCAGEAVVWVDLDKGKYYQKSQANYGKGGNGVYVCEAAAHAKYRESKDAPATYATK